MNDANLRIALVGKPNCGKTALFNALTKSRQKVANYAGVTVTKKLGFFVTPQWKRITLIDLPGTYSLRATSMDEQVTRDVLLGKFEQETNIDVILTVIDATDPEASLKLVLELKKIGKPIIVALNMIDLAQNRGIHYNLDKFSQLLGCVVVTTSAIKKNGANAVLDAIDYLVPESHENTWAEPNNEEVAAFHKESHEILAKVKIVNGIHNNYTQKIDRVLLHPVSGVIILLVVLFSVFQAVFSISTIPQGWLQDMFDLLQSYVVNLDPNSLILSLLGNGIIAGVGAALSFVPQILTIYLLIILLEDSGYMARAAFLMDKIMGSVGLSGKAFIPLLSSFACAIPGIMATRVIENNRDRLTTILVSPLMTCSARIPVYTLLISAFIPAKTVFGFANLQGLVMFLLYATGIIFGLLVAFIIKTFFFKSKENLFILELPSYKLPILSNVFFELYKTLKGYMKRASTVILAIMVVIWFLSSFPAPPSGATSPGLDYSAAGIIGHFLHPLFAPIGFDWEMVVALIPGMAAREAVVSIFATIFSLSGSEEVVSSGLVKVLQHAWSLPTALSFLTWYVFAPQCAATLAVARKETNSWKIPTIMFCYQIFLAYVCSYIVFNLANMFLR